MNNTSVLRALPAGLILLAALLSAGCGEEDEPAQVLPPLPDPCAALPASALRSLLGTADPEPRLMGIPFTPAAGCALSGDDGAALHLNLVTSERLRASAGKVDEVAQYYASNRAAIEKLEGAAPPEQQMGSARVFWQPGVEVLHVLGEAHYLTLRWVPADANSDPLARRAAVQVAAEAALARLRSGAVPTFKPEAADTE